jgi:hypothetical protein
VSVEAADDLWRPVLGKRRQLACKIDWRSHRVFLPYVSTGLTGIRASCNIV